jgi:hypothetical protein
MDFRLDDEQDLIVGTIKRFADRQLSEWAADADRAGKPPAKLMDTAGEVGFFVDAVPEAADGMLEGEYSHLTRALRSIELGRACAAQAALLEANVEPALAVGKWGSDAAQKAVFASLTGGGLAATYYDARDELGVEIEGGGLVISGKTHPAPVLGAASHVLLCTSTAVGIVATADAQVEALVPSGWRAAQWGSMICEQTRVPADFVLATGDDARAVRNEILAWHRLNLAARATGVAAAAMAHAAQYGQERVQFEQPIGTFQSLARIQDENETHVEAARLMVLHAAWLLETGNSAAPDAISRARDFAAATVSRATIDAVQIYGGYGFVNDYPVEKLMRDARAFEVLTGNEAFRRVLKRGPQRA